MSVRSADLTEKWYEYVYRDRAESVRQFVDAYPDRRALSVSCSRFGHDYRFVRPLLADPDEVLRAGKAALGRFLGEADGRDFEDAYLRVTDLPAKSDISLSEIRARHLNELYTTHGIVAETGPIRPKVVRAAFRCGKCEAVTRHVAQPGRELRTHEKCPRCNSVGYLSFAPEDSEYVDSQEIALRDPDANANGEGGPTPKAMTVLLEHDLAGSVSSGERVQVVGIPRADRSGDSTVSETWVESVSMERLTESNA
ncbi:minichromosome maintenance protein MCM [Halorussus amylolyticus]|uniref:minichromosome maintenance protein MCM n=1 Tax=Halorussus amylolyticus TaxID=1126242 RepID=UPI00104B5E79|nr:minichromosome maintenance protein MCM [Halorussus amylolyticus]